ncbi:MAG TPA: FHA domain-containing protein [Actinomycetota bacterium]|nr:FHA domain-containing protein [Actinomycetota bacterium]
MTDIITGPLGKIILLGAMYLLLAVVVWMEARELAHATTPRVSPVAPSKGKRNPSVLTLKEGVGPSSVNLVPPETLMGRDPSCHVSIPDSSVSQRHARVYHSDGEWYVEDLGSTNGTSVNDRPLTHPVLLRPGDRISIGRSVLEARA